MLIELDIQSVHKTMFWDIFIILLEAKSIRVYVLLF
jgi:hypothetical protein